VGGTDSDIVLARDGKYNVSVPDREFRNELK